MTQAGIDDAAAMVDELYQDDKVLGVFLPDCHESLAGIVAGRLRERYGKPSFVLTRAEGCAKGSGLSLIHILEWLPQVSPQSFNSAAMRRLPSSPQKCGSASTMSTDFNAAAW